MAAYNKFNCFVQDLGLKKHDLSADTINCYLIATAGAPSATTHTYYGANGTTGAQLPEFLAATANGYTVGGQSLPTKTWTASAGTSTFATTGQADVVWTATANWTAAFQFIAMYNVTSGTGTTHPLISWWDYGSALTLNNTETFTVDFGPNIFTLA